jgi:hypothetical protein
LELHEEMNIHINVETLNLMQKLAIISKIKFKKPGMEDCGSLKIIME